MHHKEFVRCQMPQKSRQVQNRSPGLNRVLSQTAKDWKVRGAFIAKSPPA
jgi:hypothetical protein